MSVQHHLDAANVLRYASGDFDEAFAVVVAAHIAMCDTCREAVRAAEEAGGSLLQDAESAELAPGSLEQMMLKLGDQHDIDDSDNIGSLVRQPSAGDVPRPLERYIGDRLDSVKWRTVGPGVRKYTIRQGSRSSLYMLHVAPGVSLPEHGHGGTELTLILSGSYTDALGVFRRGDIADLDEHVEHQPHVDDGEPCICLVATEAPTQFKGFLSRLLQPLTGI